MKKTLVAFGLVLMGVASPAIAGSITINTNPGTTYFTSGLTGFSTTGAMMDGMLFTVTFANGNVTTATWGATGIPECGAAVGAGWSVSQCGDTYAFADNWLLNSDIGISSILIDAGAGKSVLDITFATLGTDGSSAGISFTSANNPFDVTATYSNAVAIAGNAPIGDLYQLLKLEFVQPFSGSLIFTQDTDSLASPLDPVAAPEPASLLLLGTGLIGVARARRRKR